MFDWNDFLAVAAHLAQEEGAAFRRTSISRAYYAAYHAAATFVRVHRLIEGRHSHRGVWDTLIADRDDSRSEIGRRGDRLRQARIAADYHDRFPEDLGTATRNAVTEARAIIESLDRLG